MSCSFTNEKEVRLQHRLQQHIWQLAAAIGERNIWHYNQLQQTANYIEQILQATGYTVTRHHFKIFGKEISNIEVELPGLTHKDEIIVVGAHYDSHIGSPGADDNASGVAALIETARLLAQQRFARTIRFVAFANEERPFINTRLMGSYRYAKKIKKRNEKIIAMLSLETVGYYSNVEGTQKLSFLFQNEVPSRAGDFVALISNLKSRPLLKDVTAAFHRHSTLAIKSLTLPGWLPGIKSSDQWSFWKQDYPAIMITDTAPFRYPHYHSHEDTYEKINYAYTSLFVNCFSKVVMDLAIQYE